ncbi:ABC transporter ATP-binding protein [Halovivax gelatinilyticus]|uniref:ABC transporter ATP-binding protein n=1 Tax=Halovivax gelatinilyticus TaxID=2961597 RepID=UPI0020CA2B67|nr:ABC transporter ATP-binding protein [Halovivax gelatinilyticus]
MAVVQVRNLEKSFAGVDAVSGMSFDVESGELYGFLGPNGAGKTTTIRILTGQLRPDSGSVSVDGTDPSIDPIETRRRVGILPEDGMPPSFFTPREYFQYVGRLRGLDDDDVSETTLQLADRLGLERRLDTLHTDLSRGQQQKVMLVQAFLHDPDVVFIDEPLANLDPLVQEQVKSYLSAYVDDGNTVFASTHNIDVAETLCTRVGIVADGTLIAEEDLNETTDPLLEVFLSTVTDAKPRDVPRLER